MPTLPTAPQNLELRYSQLEEVIAGLLDVHPERRSTLGARIRLFRAKGFPPNPIAVSKTRFAYDFDSLVRVAVAFLMLEAFVPQEVVPTVIERAWPQLKSAYVEAYALIRAKGDTAAALDAERHVLFISPRSLHAFTLQRSVDPRAADTVDLMIVTARELADRPFSADVDGTFAPYTVIDFHRMVAWLRNALLQARWASPEQFDSFSED